MNAKTTELLRDAAEWRLIGLLFECPGESWHSQLAGLSAEISDSDLKGAIAAARDEATEGLHHSTFGPGGPAAPREVSYRETILPGQVLGEISAYYKAFAYEPATQEPPDHVSVATGFIAYLRLKEAYAVAREDAAQAAVAADAAKRFIEDHLSTLAEPLARSLAASGIRYLALASASLRRRVGPRRQVSIAAIQGEGQEAP
jgi:nitrate reductase assembly molybdenum cofactor insertion protein NarJ